VTAHTAKLEATFIEKQRHTLTKLRAQLLTATRGEEADEAAVTSETAGGSREYEDDAQRLAMLELKGNLIVRDVERLDRVNRALKKIEEGSYGLSDMSGAPIPRERLEAAPESIFTLAEEQARERRSSALR
jgi:DnaK suppressor protein